MVSPDSKLFRERGNEPLYASQDRNSIFYLVEFYVLPQIAQRGDIYLGGSYKQRGQGFGGYTPSKISSPQNPVTNGKGLVLLSRFENNPVTSDQIVFLLVQDGKNLVEKVFPFNVANHLPKTSINPIPYPAQYPAQINRPESSVAPSPYGPIPRMQIQR